MRPQSSKINKAAYQKAFKSRLSSVKNSIGGNAHHGGSQSLNKNPSVGTIHSIYSNQGSKAATSIKRGMNHPVLTSVDSGGAAQM